MNSPHDNHSPARERPGTEVAGSLLDGSLTEAGFDALPTQVAILDTDAKIVYTNRAWRRFGDENGFQGPAHSIGVNYLAVCDDAEDDHAETAAEGIRSVLGDDRDEFSFEYPCHGPDEQRWFSMRAIRFPHENEEFVLVAHLNITERKHSELRVAAQNDEIETYNQVNTIVRDVVDSLLDGVTRDEIEATVCERLATSHLYGSALVVAPALDGDELSARQASSIDGAAWLAAVDDDRTTLSELDAALDGSAVEAVQYLHDSPTVPDALKDVALGGGYRSFALVPISYLGHTYGVLVVNALRPEAFGENETHAFEVLGETIGYAINAVENRRLLFADTLTELELTVGDDSVLVGLAAATDCSFEVDGAIPSPAGLHCYLRVRGTSPDSVVDDATDRPGVERARVLEGGATGGTVECTLTDSPLRYLLDTGATVSTVRVTAESMRLHAVVPPETDIRTLVEGFTAASPTAELVAKRETDRAVQSVEGFREHVRTTLTERQRQTVEAAYRGGYFKQPRESSGGELAETFDIAGPTFHQHLQAGLNKLSGLTFDESRH
jgi:predicted DNA binding protein